MVSSKKVCVVGAGVSGLVSARELLREGHDVTVMEQSAGGGQWLYDPSTEASDPLGDAGVHSGVYASLRVNLPRDTMGFSGFPFYPKNDGTGNTRLYPGHGEFLRYIRDFCDAFGLMDVVRLNTKVLHIGLAPPRTADDGIKRWTVRWPGRGDCEGEAIDHHGGGVRRSRRRRLPVHPAKAPYNQRHGQVEHAAAALPLVPGPGLLRKPSGGDRGLA